MGIEDQQKGWGGAVDTSVTWSNHSQRVAVRGERAQVYPFERL